MKLGKVELSLSYVVDLENETMVDHAMIALYEDIISAVKYDKINHLINTYIDHNAIEDDIPEFLIDSNEEEV